MLHELRKNAGRLLCVLAAAAGCAFAQCDGVWLDGIDQDYPGTDGPVFDMVTWDPDGAGPAPAGVVVGGQFSIAGGVLASGVAFWDGSRFSRLGDGLNGPTGTMVRTLAVRPDGDLVAGGTFTASGATPIRQLAVFHAGRWRELAGGVSVEPESSDAVAVNTLELTRSGLLLVGGRFDRVGPLLSKNMAMLGTQWASLGSAYEGVVRTLIETSQGDLIVGGDSFTLPGGSASVTLLRRHGTTWSSIPNAPGFSVARCAIQLADGRLAIVGEPLSTGAMGYISNLAADQWSPFGPNSSVPDRLLTIRQLRSGQLVVGGVFRSFGNSARSIAVQSGSSWGPMAPASTLAYTSDEWVRSIHELPDGRIIAGGSFQALGNAVASNIAHYKSQRFGAMNATAEAPIGGVPNLGHTLARCVQVLNEATNAYESRIVAWNGRNWIPATPPLATGPSAFAIDDSGTTCFIGTQRFSRLNWCTSANIWNGQSFTRLASCDDSLSLPLALGGGRFAFEHWMANTPSAAPYQFVEWSPQGVRALDTSHGWPISGASVAASRITGEIVAFGRSNSNLIADHLMRLHNGTWLPVEPALSGQPPQLVFDELDRLYAAGTIGSATLPINTRVLRYREEGWEALGGPIMLGASPSPRVSIATLPGGRLVMVGRFDRIGETACANAAFWDGERWLPIAGGIDTATTDLFMPSVAASGPDEVVLWSSTPMCRGNIVSSTWTRWSATGVPWIVTPPADQLGIGRGSTVTLMATPASNYEAAGPVVLSWERDGVPLADDGRVSGAASERLVIRSVRAEDEGQYVCRVTNQCGSRVSDPAMLTVCLADIDANGRVDGADTEAFFAAWQAGASWADMNRDGGVDGDDVTAFFDRVAVGCR